MWVVVDISHAGTELGRNVKMTRGGAALAVYYICDHETDFGEWPGIELYLSSKYKTTCT